MTKYILDHGLDIQPLINMRKMPKKILAEAEDEIDEMAAVQVFEVSYELALGTLAKKS